jgi:hypothetical protein
MTDINQSSWSETDASNNSTAPAGWPEGMAPSTVNDAARANMGAIKRWYDRINATATSGGSANTQTISYSVAATALVTGDMFSFKAGFTNSGATTLNIDSLGAKNVLYKGGALTGGEIVANQYFTVIYDGTSFNLVRRSNNIEITSGTSGGIPYFSSTTALASSSLLAANAIVIGGGAGTAPSTEADWTVASHVLKGNFNSGSLPSAPTGTVIQIGNANSTATNATIDSFTATSGVLLRRSAGTAASPSAIQSGDAIGQLVGSGYGSSTYSSAADSAKIYFQATQTWTDAHRGEQIIFSTTANNGSTASDQMQLSQDGGLVLPAGGAVSQGSGTVNAANGLYVNGVAVIAHADWTVASNTLTGNFNGASPPAKLTGTILQLNGGDSNDNIVLNEAYANIPTIAMRRADGTGASPSAIQSGDVIGRFGAYGYGSTGYSSAARARIDFVANQTWTDSNQGTKVQILGLANNTTSPMLALATFAPAGSTLTATNTNDDAASGYYGEEMHSSVLVASAVSLTSGAITNVTSLALTAGDWEVSGSVAFKDSTVTSSTLHQAAISTGSGTFPTVGSGNNYTSVAHASLNGGSDIGDTSFVLPVGPTRISLSANTTYYLNANEAFGGGTTKAYGYMHARRAR